MVRPPAAVVHWSRSGQLAHDLAKDAVPSPSGPRRMSTVTLFGQVTVPAPRSISKRSLVNNPPAALGDWVLHPEAMLAPSSLDWNSPVP